MSPISPLPATADAPEAFDFRRRGTPPRRKRRHPLLLLVRPLVAAALLVAGPTALAGWVLTSPRFALGEVVVEGGTARVPANGIRAAVAPLEGRNLVLLPLADVEARIRRNPWIDALEIQKELPGRLRVQVTERRPVALLLRRGAPVYADAEGRPIVAVPPEEREQARKAGLVLVTFARPQRSAAEGVESALEVAGELGRVQPDWAAQLTRIEVLGESDFRLHTGALRFPLLVASGQVAEKVRHLDRLLPELARRYPAIQSVDLRFQRRIVVQPAPKIVGHPDSRLNPLPGGEQAPRS